MTSIAVSAVLRPSRILRLMLLGASLAAAMSAAMIAFGWVGEIPLFVRLMIGACCLRAAGTGFFPAVRLEKTYRVDISGLGQIRLAVVQGVAGDAVKDQTFVPRFDNERAEVVRLMDGSTLWPQLMLLRLQAKHGGVATVLILPDCVSSDTFRALAAALRWIVAHNDAAEHAGTNAEPSP